PRRSSDLGGKYNVSGVIAGSGGGTATVDNSGYIGVAGSYITTGIEASAPFGAEVNNSGDVYAAYGLVTYGVNMDGAGGDAVLNNTGSIQSYGILVSYGAYVGRSEEHTSELQSRENLVCRLLLEKKNNGD